LGFLYEDGVFDWRKGWLPGVDCSFDDEVKATFMRHRDAWVRSIRGWYPGGWRRCVRKRHRPRIWEVRWRERRLVRRDWVGDPDGFSIPKMFPPLVMLCEQVRWKGATARLAICYHGKWKRE